MEERCSFGQKDAVGSAFFECSALGPYIDLCADTGFGYFGLVYRYLHGLLPWGVKRGRNRCTEQSLVAPYHEPRGWVVHVPLAYVSSASHKKSGFKRSDLMVSIA